MFVVFLIQAEAVALTLSFSEAQLFELTSIMRSFLSLWILAHHESWTFLILSCLFESNEFMQAGAYTWVLSRWTQTNDKKDTHQLMRI